MKFEVLKYADVSTSHIAHSDAQLLEQENREWALNFHVIARYPEGFFLSIGNEFSETDAKDVVSSGFSKEFALLLSELHNQGISLLWNADKRKPAQGRLKGERDARKLINEIVSRRDRRSRTPCRSHSRSWT